MKEDKKQRSFKTQAAELKIIRRRPLCIEQVEKINKIFERDIQTEKEDPSALNKKIAIDRDSGIDT